MNFKEFNFGQFRRILLYVATAVVAVLLWNAWNKEHPSNTEASQQTQTSSTGAPSSFVPPSYTTTGAQPQSTAPNSSPTPPQAAGQQAAPATMGVNVKTDVLDVNIDSQGNLVDAKLRKYNEALGKNPQPMPILSSAPETLYLAQSGLKAVNATATEAIPYHADQSQYTLADGQNNLTVKLVGTTPAGLQVTKTFEFTRNKYDIRTTYQIHNSGTSPWAGNIYQQIVRKNVPPPGSQHSRSYIGAAISSLDKPYQKIPFKKLNEEQINQNVQGGWIAMQQPYFLTAWIPPGDQANHFYSSVSNNIYTLGYVGAPLTVAPGADVSQKSTFYAGPELPDDLKTLGKGLDLTIDYGWLWMISKAIFWVMDHVHSVVGNWGWSIIITTLLIKLLFYKLSEKSYASMAKMREIQPRLQALKERYGEDKQALSKATMEFYKKEKINPLGGCLPTVIQIPVFIALYYVLIESVQLRQAPFIFWIRDLSVHDPYYILPILMGISMFVQQRLSPPPPDPAQAKMMMFLPVVFTVFFLSFPAGLVLYWLVNNCTSILQQWYIMKTYKNPKPKSVTKKKPKAKTV
jgi:YidC/Oxa1 family membrane protein insertase